jgi:aryl-alcohol dehydrogenase-like predicted oxidoreductase
MKQRLLGKTGFNVAPLAFGGNVFGWTADEAMSFRLLDTFVDKGFNLIDTADVYTRWIEGHKGGESETIIGRWLKKSGKRDKVVIATKVGMDMGEGKSGLSAKRVKAAVEESLQRLQTDHIDLYQSHKDDPGTPLEETLGAYADLIKQGKVRAIGASNYTAERLAEALDVAAKHNLPAYQTLQPEYNLYDRAGYESGLEILCEEQGIGVITYFSLAAGFLTGKYRSEADLKQSPRGRKVAAYLNERGRSTLHALDKVAQEHKATPAAVALAWLTHRPSVTAPIASATKIEQLEELMKGATLLLSREDIALLDEASSP